eukprot:747574-Hanusia_phi.AAC.18
MRKFHDRANRRVDLWGTASVCPLCQPGQGRVESVARHERSGSEVELSDVELEAFEQDPKNLEGDRHPQAKDREKGGGQPCQEEPQPAEEMALDLGGVYAEEQKDPRERSESVGPVSLRPPIVPLVAERTCRSLERTTRTFWTRWLIFISDALRWKRLTRSVQELGARCPIEAEDYPLQGIENSSGSATQPESLSVNWVASLPVLVTSSVRL